MDDASTNLLELPDDPAALRNLVLQLRGDLIQRAQAITARDAMIEQIKNEAAQRIEALQQTHKAEIETLLRRFYGPRSERFDPRQFLLFGITIDSLPLDKVAVEEESGQDLLTRRPRRKGRHNHGRQKLPAHLERIRIVHDLPEDQKVCEHGHPRQQIGEEITEQLEYRPASFVVLQHVRLKYACKPCEGNGDNPRIELADKPPQPIDKGLAGPGLLAYVITSKLADHLPLYRLERIFGRHDLHIAGSTMCAWMAAAAMLVKPLVDLMTEGVKSSRVIHTDETRVPVQDPQVKGRCKNGRIWTYLGDATSPYVVYSYTPDRTRAGPQGFLAEYKGYLQADAYGGYDGIYARGVIEVACWAHARRKFFDAKDTDSARAAAMLEMVQELYAVEHEAQGLDDDGRQALRQEKSLPALVKIKAWLDENIKRVLPRSPMAGAIQYTLNQWEALCRYAEHGFLNIDNNAAERALKRVAIGRKNWLFAGNDQFGQFHATLWSLIASAERHGLDPQRYLTSVLAKIGQTPISQLGQFLPDCWKADLAAESTARR